MKSMVRGAAIFAFVIGAIAACSSGNGPNGNASGPSCGHSGEPCCTGEICATGVACQSGMCTIYEASVEGGTAPAGLEAGGDALAADDGEAGAPVACGDAGEPCCANQACTGSLACRSGSCRNVPANGTGAPCRANSDCPSGICQPVGQPTEVDAGWTGNVCTTTCTSASDCVAGWTCASELGQSSNVCKCMYSQQMCDDKDDDCDGIVDDEPASDEWCARTQGTGFVCRAGSCECALMCPVDAGVIGCVNPQTDASNCGGCGTACPTGGSCQSGTCACPITARSVCSGACVDEQSDDGNCGGCGTICPIGGSCQGGTCTCPSATPTVCGHACADEQTDDQNCGACGTTCAGVCSLGRCQLTLATDQDPSAVVVQDPYVYWVNASTGALMRAPIEGGTSTTLLGNNEVMGPLAVSPSNIYFGGAKQICVDLVYSKPSNLPTCEEYENVGPQLEIIPIDFDGGAAGIVGTGVEGLGTSASNVYWIDSSGLETEPFDASPGAYSLVLPENFLPQQSLTGGNVAVGDTTIYTFGDSCPNQGATSEGGTNEPCTDTLLAVPVDGGIPTTRATGSFGSAVLTNSNGVYTTGSSSCDGGACTDILEFPFAGGGPFTVVSGNIGSFVIDDSNVYWTLNGTSANDYADGVLMKTTLNGGPSVTLARGDISVVAIDATSVYFTVIQYDPYAFLGYHIVRLSPK